MPRVTFLPSGRSFEVRRGGTLFRAVLRARLPIARSCRGTGICGLCHLRVVGPVDGLAPPGEPERALAARRVAEAGGGAGERFACLAIVVGDVAVTAAYW